MWSGLIVAGAISLPLRVERGAALDQKAPKVEQIASIVQNGVVRRARRFRKAPIRKPRSRSASPPQLARPKSRAMLSRACRAQSVMAVTMNCWRCGSAIEVGERVGFREPVPSATGRCTRAEIADSTIRAITTSAGRRWRNGWLTRNGETSASISHRDGSISVGQAVRRNRAAPSRSTAARASDSRSCSKRKRRVDAARDAATMAAAGCSRLAGCTRPTARAASSTASSRHTTWRSISRAAEPLVHGTGAGQAPQGESR